MRGRLVASLHHRLNKSSLFCATVRSMPFPLSIYLSIYLSIHPSIHPSILIYQSQTPLRYLGGAKTAKRLGTIECCLNGTAHAQAHVQDGFRWHELEVINTAQNFFVKGNLNLVRKGDRLNFKIMFRSGFREFEDDPFFRLAKRR